MKANRTLSAVLAMAATSAFALTPITIKVDGEGYLRLVKEGRVVFARELALTSVDGKLGCKDGVKVLPEIAVPEQAENIKVSLDGTVTLTGKNGSWKAGRLVLGLFAPSSAMSQVGPYTVSSERAQLTYPGEETAGVIVTEGEQKTVLAAKTEKPDPVKPEPANPVGKPVKGPEIKPQVKPQTKPTPNAPAHLRVELHSEVELNGEFATLKDLANLSGPEADVAKASAIKVDNVPAITVVRRVDATRIRALLKLAGLDVTKVEILGGPMVNLKRVSQTATFDQFQQAATDALKPLLGPTAKLIPQNSATGPTVLPTGNLEIRVGNKGVNGPRATATVEAWVDGKKITSRTLQFSVEGMLPKPRIGQSVRVISKIGGVKIETTGRVTRVSPDGSEIEVETQDKTKLIGNQVADGSIEVKA